MTDEAIVGLRLYGDDDGKCLVCGEDISEDKLIHPYCEDLIDKLKEIILDERGE